jgi:hypothetical protein
MDNTFNLDHITTKFNYEISTFLDYIATNSANIENNYKRLLELYYEDIKENPNEKR